MDYTKDILVIDDEKVILDAIQKIVTLENLTSDACLDVDEALDVTTTYAIKMQSVVQEYEARVDSLIKYIEDSKVKIKEIKETNNK